MRAASKPDSRGCGSAAGAAPMAGFAGLLDGFEDGLRAPGEAVDLALAAVAEAGALGVVLVEGGVDAAQDGFERNTGLAPGLDQRPVERGEHEQRAAALLEAGLDLGEVVEVVHGAGARQQVRGVRQQRSHHYPPIGCGCCEREPESVWSASPPRWLLLSST